MQPLLLVRCSLRPLGVALALEAGDLPVALGELRFQALDMALQCRHGDPTRWLHRATLPRFEWLHDDLSGSERRRSASDRVLTVRVRLTLGSRPSLERKLAFLDEHAGRLGRLDKAAPDLFRRFLALNGGEAGFHRDEAPPASRPGQHDRGGVPRVADRAESAGAYLHGDRGKLVHGSYNGAERKKWQQAAGRRQGPDSRREAVRAGRSFFLPAASSSWRYFARVGAIVRVRNSTSWTAEGAADAALAQSERGAVRRYSSGAA